METITTPVFQNKSMEEEFPPGLHPDFTKPLELFFGSTLLLFPKYHCNGVFPVYAGLPKASCRASEIRDAGY